MDIKNMNLAIEQAQKVCSEMPKCANKFILQNSINEMNQALNIDDVSNQRELLIAFMEYLSELPMGIDDFDQKELLDDFESNL